MNCTLACFRTTFCLSMTDYLSMTETMRRFALAFAAVLLLAALPVPTRAQTTAVVGGTVHPVSGPEIQGGVVLMEGSEITAVGPRDEVTIPESARRIDATGQVVTPGFIDAATSTGLVEVSSVGGTRDAALQTEDPVRAAFRVTDGINPNTTVIPITRLGGVTTVAAIPSGGAIAGQGAVIDLYGERLSDMLVQDQAAMYASYTPEGTEETGEARGGLSLRLREAFEDAQFYRENEGAYDRGAYDRGAIRDLVISRLDLEALGPVLAGEVPLIVRAARASDIDAVLRVTREYGIEPVILGGEEAWMRADVLTERDVPVIVKPLTNSPTEFDRLGSRFDNASLLAEAGVRVALSTMDTHNARNLRFEAGNAVRAGMGWTEALRAATLAPAQVLGVADTHGSLQPGKTANVVVWSGDPFEFSTSAEHVFIRGQEIDHDSRQLRLLQRYRTLGQEPAAYKGTGEE